MVDPASIAQLVGLGAQLADECLKVIKSLKQFREKFQESSHTLSVLATYCRIIHAAIEQIRLWASTKVANSSIPTASIAAIQHATDDILTCIRLLHHDINLILEGKRPEEAKFGAKIKSLWNEDIRSRHAQQIHILAAGLQLLLSATMMYEHSPLLATNDG